MTASKQLTAVAARLNRRIGVLRRSGLDDMEVLGEMGDHMAEFKMLMDAWQDDFASNVLPFEHVYWFGVLLTDLAEAIRAGDIEVPGGSVH